MGKLIIFITLTAIYVSVPVHNTIITTTDGGIYCDGITCPKGSTSCTVSKKTFGDLSLYKYTRFCSDAHGVPTRTVEHELPNPCPGATFDSVSSSCGNHILTEDERKEFNEEFEKVAEDTAKWTKDFNEDLAKQFPPGFPFN